MSDEVEVEVTETPPVHVDVIFGSGEVLNLTPCVPGMEYLIRFHGGALYVCHDGSALILGEQSRREILAKFGSDPKLDRLVCDHTQPKAPRPEVCTLVRDRSLEWVPKSATGAVPESTT